MLKCFYPFWLDQARKAFCLMNICNHTTTASRIIIHFASMNKFFWEFHYNSKISKGFILLFLKNHTREAKRGKRIQKERQMKFPFYTISMREYLTSHFSVSYNAQFKALSFICVILYKQPWIPVALTNPIWSYVICILSSLILQHYGID